MTTAGSTYWPPAHDEAKDEPKTLLSELKRRRENKAKFLEGMKAAEAELADLDRAIAALSPAPSEEAGKGEDAPEIPEGFTKWEGGECPFDIGTRLEVLTRKNGVWPVTIKPEAPLLWEHEGHDLDIIAYRVLPSEPAAEAKGEEEPEEAEFAPPTEGLIEKMERLIRERDTAATDTITIASSSQHAEESDRAKYDKALRDADNATDAEIDAACRALAEKESARAQNRDPLFPPKPPQAATPEQLEAVGVIDSEASWWARKLAKEPA